MLGLEEEESTTESSQPSTSDTGGSGGDTGGSTASTDGTHILCFAVRRLSAEDSGAWSKTKESGLACVAPGWNNNNNNVQTSLVIGTGVGMSKRIRCCYTTVLCETVESATRHSIQ